MTEGAAAADEAVGSEHALLVPSQVSVTWQELVPSDDTTLEDSATIVAVTNGSDEDATASLRLVGDYGTTQTAIEDLGVIEVPAGATIALDVDLSVVHGGKSMTYAGAAHVSAEILRDGVVEEQVVGENLYYHPTPQGLQIYREARLREAHAAGDVWGLSPELLESEDPEDQATVRIVAFEPTGGATDQIAVSHAAPRGLVEPNGTASSYTQRLCVNFQVETVDSGFQSSSGVTEDVWANANNPVLHKANYIRVKIGSTTYDTDHAGCINFTTSVPHAAQTVRVYALAADDEGNFVRVHNAGPTSTGTYPGTNRSWTVSNVTFYTGITTTLPVGDNYSARSTMMGAFARSLRRYADGMQNTEIHVAEDSTGTVANFNYFNDFTNNESYISILTDQRRFKFLIAHEYGHAYLHQTANSGTPNANPMLTSTGPGCDSENPLYDSTSEEWSSTAFTEGYAHFISARVWNHKAANGWFNFGGSSRTELENFNATNDPGGHMVNVCCQGNASCTTSADGHGVIFDWMRALWDMHDGISGCGLDRWDMMYFFALIVNSNPAEDEYYGTSEAMSVLFGSSCVSWWEQLACHNGINTDGTMWSQPC